MHAVSLTVSFTIHSIFVTKWTKATKKADLIGDFRGFSPWAFGSALLDRASWRQEFVVEVLPFMVARKYMKWENTGGDQDERYRWKQMLPLTTQQTLVLALSTPRDAIIL